MSGLLIELCKQHHISMLDHRVQCVKDTADFNCCAKAFFQHIDFDFLVQFNSLNRFVVSEINNSVFPPTNIYSLLHWKILALLIRLSDDSEILLSYHQPLKLRNITYQSTKNVIDAHFHLDKLFMQDRFPVLPSYKWEHYSDNHVQFNLSMLIVNFVLHSR